MILFRAVRQELKGDAIYKEFGIRATPTVMMLAPDGSEVDWTVGYEPPPEKFQEKIERMVAGVDTFKSLSAAYAKNPKDVAVVFKLARKYSDRYDEAKAAEKYKEVIALDPQGKAGTYTHEYYKITVPYAEYAEYSLADMSLDSQKPDVGPMTAFLKKHPDSKMLKQTYASLAGYYRSRGSKEEAARFFAEFAAKFPNDTDAYRAWLARIVRDQDPLAMGFEIADKLDALRRNSPDNPDPALNQTMAQLYLLKNDKAKAEEVYGKNFISGEVSNTAFSLINYANFWVQQNANLDSAVEMAETAVKLQPDSSFILQQAAGVYLTTGKEEKALVLYGPAYAKKNSSDASALYSYARFWAAQGKNLADALAASKRTTELFPATYDMWSTLADIHQKMKNYPEAIKAAEKAAELAEGPAKEAMQKKVDQLKTEAQGKK